mmetsp:Transcript_22001/g.33615  ORF Transcript_22001/g.33615 Transcript_22001/m.33615 type:complete len:122 (+) Transcript_22001:394-759(+)
MVHRVTKEEQKWDKQKWLLYLSQRQKKSYNISMISHGFKLQTEQSNIRSMWAYRDNRNNKLIRKRLDNVMTNRFFHLVDNNSSLLRQYSSKKYDVTATTTVGDSNNRNTTQRRGSALWRLR